MRKDLRLTFEQSNDVVRVIQKAFDIPSHCPWCEAKIAPVILNKSEIGFTHGDRDDFFSILFSCPSCKKHFMNQYSINYDFAKNNVSYFLKVNSIPVKKGEFSYDEIINEICSDFEEIIDQAKSAEGLNLHHLAGMGYRKATEFLVKDYLIKYKKHDENEISKKLLGGCIKLLDDDRIRALAEATAWIGNDETHYIRKHEDRDVKDLKKFLHSITLFISYELSIDDAKTFTSKD